MSTRNGGKFSYVADFETTTDPTDCRVWLWGVCNIDTLEIRTGTSIETFCAYVSTIGGNVYFHNLAFDGAFILDYILKQGFKHRLGNPHRKQFSTLISNMGKFYSITVIWDNGIRTSFRDSLKKLPMSVKRIAETFKLEESKGSIDYHAVRPIGYKPTANELSYLDNDLVIVAKALKIQLNQGMTKLTIGADSLAQYKHIVTKRVFDRMFPILPDTMDADIRSAYRGGFTIVNKRYQQVIVGPGNTYDVNSLYPSVMYSQSIPYGEPQYFTDVPDWDDLDYPLFIVSITFTGRLRDGYLPCIQIKGNPLFSAVEYLESIPEPVTLSCTNVDLALWLEHYDLDILSYNGGWKFHAINGMFNDYIDKWMEVKRTTEGGERAIAKLFLNSLYGKFATNPDVTPKIPYLDNGVVKLKMGESETRNPVYTAVGVFITAYARDVTIRAAQQNYDSFVYADTDSLHLLGDEPDTLTVDPSELGAWKHESEWSKGLFVRAKCYIEVIDGKHVAHVAGLPEAVAQQLTIDSFVDGATFGGKLLPQRVSGGIVLRDVGFTLNL